MKELILKSVSIDWDTVPCDSYIRDIEAVRNTNKIRFSKAVTFFSGENGTGKSTVLEAIALALGFNPEGGTKNYMFSTYDSHSELYNALKIERSLRRAGQGYFFRAESFYNVATMEEEYSKLGGRPRHFHLRSHGESFLELIRSFSGNALYIMDEPEAALSPLRQLSFMAYIKDLTDRGAQFIIATQSPILLGMPGSEIFSFDGGKVHTVQYEETDSYSITRAFIMNREKVLKELFEDEDHNEES